MGEPATTVVGPAFEIVRSGSVEPLPLLTVVDVVVVDVKFCGDFDTATDAVLLITVPFAAVTMPVMVTTHVPPPSTEPPLQVTRFVLCVQEPRVLVICSCGGTPMPPTPLI